jgi:phosphatidylglycerophosphatase C
VPALLDYALAGADRGLLKSRAIRALMAGDARTRVERWAERFVADLKPRGAFRMTGLSVLEEHRQAGDRLVLLSASPDLYVPLIGRLLGFERTVCTEIVWNGDLLDGALRTPNRHGLEKVRCLEQLRAEYAPTLVTAYGNSISDLHHLALAERPLLVNGNAAARRAAARVGVPTAKWP